MGRTSWVCSTCHEHFTRRFSAERHNKTFHSGKGVISKLGDKLILSESRRILPERGPVTRHSTGSIVMASNRACHRPINNRLFVLSDHTGCYSGAGVETMPLTANPVLSKSASVSNLLEGTLAVIKPFVEIKKILNELKSCTHTALIDRPLLGQNQNYLYPFPSIRHYPTSQGLPFGFRIHLCQVCLTNSMYVVRYLREPEFHTCSQADLSIIRRPIERFEAFKKLTKSSGLLLFSSISRFKSLDFRMLRAIRLNAEKPEGIEITNPSDPEQSLSLFAESERTIELDMDRSSEQWDEKMAINAIRRACIGGQARLDRNELFAYLELVRTATFAFLIIKFKGVIHRYFIHIFSGFNH